MKINLQNIGIVKDSNIQLDGLTIITGQNNSGKTTVGKVIYSLIDAVSNLQQKARLDRQRYIERVISRDVTSALDMFRVVRHTSKAESVFGEDSIFEQLFLNNSRNTRINDDVEAFAHHIHEELKNINFEQLKTNKEFIRYNSRIISTRHDPEAVIEVFENQTLTAIAILEKMFRKVENDAELLSYARESINYTLRKEFASQIQPVSKKVAISKIKLIDEDSICFKIDIVNNQIKNTEDPVFISVPYKQAFFIDNPFIIDTGTIGARALFRRQDDEESDTFLDTDRILTHDFMLKNVLKSKRSKSFLEESVIKDELIEIKRVLDEAIPGEFEFGSEGEYYVNQGKKLRISNLATGSKMFSIIKVLLEKGEISDTTMLILDEPEAHLHPSWQNKFAEVIVLLVKILKVNILLTTHSPNFTLAIDAYMRKYDISNVTNFYQTEQDGDGFIKYKCVNGDMGIIYSDFMQYLSEVKALRDTFVDE